MSRSAGYANPDDFAQWLPYPSESTSHGLFAPLLYAAIPSNAVTFSLMATVVRRATPTQAAATAYLVPVFGVFFGWLIRDERLGQAEIAGGVLVVLGVIIVVSAANSRR